MNDPRKTLQDLQNQKAGLEDRIRRIERDLTSPLEANSTEQAGELTHMLVLRSILESEKSNLRKINVEIERIQNNELLG